jgi:TRAP-type C4-dicarboxylate transport system substrate-binding protein
MKMLRRTVLATLSLLPPWPLPMGAIAQDIKPRLIRFGYGLNEQSNQGRAVKVFAEQVEKLSGGKMKIRAVGAAALGPDTQMQQALIGGAQEMMVGSTATLVGITKEMALWDTPFLFNSAKEADAVLDGPIGQKVMDKLQEKGLVGLVYWENGFRNLTNSKRPVTKLEDLDGIKLRVMQNPVYLDSFKTAGRQRHPAAVLRTVQRAGDQDGGRPGEPVQHHPVQQVLRGAEVPQRDQPRLQPVDRDWSARSGGTSSPRPSRRCCWTPPRPAASTSARTPAPKPAVPCPT